MISMNPIDRNFPGSSVSRPQESSGSAEAQHEALRAELRAFAEEFAGKVRQALETKIAGAVSESLATLEAGLSKNMENLKIVKTEEDQGRDVKYLNQMVQSSLDDAMKNAKQIITNRLSTIV